MNLIDTGALAAVARACAGNEDVADFGAAAASAEDGDVSAERHRVERLEVVSSQAASSRPDTITLSNLRKVFDTNQGAASASASEGCCSSASSQSNSSAPPAPTKKIAVRRLTLGIPDGQCFGLLGACSLHYIFVAAPQLLSVCCSIITCLFCENAHPPVLFLT